MELRMLVKFVFSLIENLLLDHQGRFIIQLTFLDTVKNAFFSNNLIT